jgi:hypothetical protein
MYNLQESDKEHRTNRDDDNGEENIYNSDADYDDVYL